MSIEDQRQQNHTQLFFSKAFDIQVNAHNVAFLNGLSTLLNNNQIKMNFCVNNENAGGCLRNSGA